MEHKEILSESKKTIKEQADAVIALGEHLDESFVKAVDLIYNCHGRVIITGIGKSGIIGKKIAATFASTGTPSYFVHSAEGIHGDLGMILNDDIVIIISRSGDTEEINNLLPSIKAMGIKIISITSCPSSTLGKYSDVVLNINVKKEAGHLGLAPTTSTTVTLVLGDALAIALLKIRNFKPEDFALFHPGGILGRKLLLKVEDLMHKHPDIPIVTESCSIKEALCEMTSKRLGMTAIVDENGKLSGILTDGDLRRILEKEENLFDLKLTEIMTKNPKNISKDKLAADALRTMEDYSITSLLVLDTANKPLGVIHMHDIIKAGIEG